MTITIIYEDAFENGGIKEISNVIDYKLNCTELGNNIIEIEFENKVLEYNFYRIIKINEYEF